MMNNSCERCKIYFPNNEVRFSCPKCGDYLESRPDDKRYVASKWDPKTNEVTPIEVPAKRRADSKTQSQTPASQRSDSIGTPPAFVADTPVRPQQNRRAYAGIINNYERIDVGYQSFIERASLFFRGMHHGNTRHVITFVDEGDNQTYRVCFYGEFSAIGSAIPQIGEHIVVGDRPSGNTFNSENVYIGANDGRRIRLRSQNPPRQRINPVPVIIAIVVLIVLFVVVRLAMSGELSMIGLIFETFLIATAVTFILGLVFLSRRLNFRSLAIGSVVIGALYTAFAYDIGGFATQFGDILLVGLASAVTLILMIVGLRYIITGGRR